MAWGNSFDQEKIIAPFDDYSGKVIAERQKQDIVINPWPIPVPFKEMAEAAKLYADAVLFGEGWAQDGKHVPLDKIYNNTIPTHDPYTNPNAHIYYECACGAILDPQTKSFAALNNCASEKGWKIRFGEYGYTPYCVKCGEEVE